MKKIALAVLAIAVIASPLAAKTTTTKLPGVYKAEAVKTLCRRYGGSFFLTGKGHGCTRQGYGRVTCSAKGVCVAVYRSDLKVASN